MAYSSMLSGLLILPGMTILVFGNLVYAKYSIKITPSLLAIYATILTSIGAGMLFIVSMILSSVPTLGIIGCFSLMSFGIGILVPAITTLLMEASGKEYSSIAGATLNANKQIGGLFGTAIMGLVISAYGDGWKNIITITFFINLIVYLIAILLLRKAFITSGKSLNLD